MCLNNYKISKLFPRYFKLFANLNKEETTSKFHHVKSANYNYYYATFFTTQCLRWQNGCGFDKRVMACSVNPCHHVFIAEGGLARVVRALKIRPGSHRQPGLNLSHINTLAYRDTKLIYFL